MSGLQKLFTTRDLAARYGCKPRAVARKAALGHWPSTMVLGQYRFDAAMVAWIDTHRERWPENRPQPATQPKQQPVKQARQRRTPQPPPATDVGSNVRRLVAKDRSNRVRRVS